MTEGYTLLFFGITPEALKTINVYFTGCKQFTMIHGYTVTECDAEIQAIKEKTGLNDYVILYSERELKKVGVRI